ncbi:hypothetical protein HanHA300_Chr13g0477181 [Helianthus annuus]|nr:hypothetical protein HanHA300_Chr13g0477181 [Helianthus annuus]KAJ0497239.1 hypothetical protein HanHA89_Chr13g0509241 [Helianthus annuus]
MPEQLGQRTIKMATINVQHMNDGNGDSSYASNSFLQVSFNLDIAIHDPLRICKRIVT